MEIKKLLKVGTCLKIPVLFTSERFYSTIHGVLFRQRPTFTEDFPELCILADR